MFFETEKTKLDRFLYSVAVCLALVLGLYALAMARLAISARDLGSLVTHVAHLAESVVLFAVVIRSDRLWSNLRILRKLLDDERSAKCDEKMLPPR